MVRLREVTLSDGKHATGLRGGTATGRASSRFIPFLLICLACCGTPSAARASDAADKTRWQPVATVEAADASRLTHAGALLTDLPPNLRVPRDLRPVLEQALRRSPTFQRQLQTLLRTQRVRMSVSYGGLRGMRLFQARSVVTHHQWGALMVDTTLFVPADMVELVAHEIEHVCEQIEGVDLRALAGRHDSGVYDVGGHYETQRAITIGRRVAREVQALPAEEQTAQHVTY
jgi:hypothetical protein